MTKIQILDNTLHLLQDLESTLSLSEKIKLALKLDNLGVRTIDLGRIKNCSDMNLVKEISKICQSELSVIVGLDKDEVVLACKTLKFAKYPRIQIHIQKLDQNLELTLNKIESLVQLGREHKVKVLFSVAEYLEGDIDSLWLMIQKAIQSGSDAVALSDDQKYATPDQFAALVRYIKQKMSTLDPATLVIQCHSHLGLAMANTWSGIVNGATEITTTYGLSKPSGECELEDILKMLRWRYESFGDYQLAK